MKKLLNNLQKSIFLKIILVVFILAMIIPAVKLFNKYLDVIDRNYALEISNNEVLVKYLYQDEASPMDYLSNIANYNADPNTVVKSNRLILQEFDAYINELNKEYGLIETGENSSSTNLNLSVSGLRDQSGSGISSGVGEPITLDPNNVTVVSSLKKMEVIQEFSGVHDNNSSNVVLNFDKEAKHFDKDEKIKTYLADADFKNYERPVTDFLLKTANKFYTSPKPSENHINRLKDLNSLKLILDKAEYYRFEVIRANLVTERRIDITDLKIYVSRGKYLIPNVGGKHDFFFRYNAHTIYTAVAMGYNPSPGKYNIIVKSLSNPNWEGLKVSFILKRRVPARLEKGYSILNWEYGPYIKKFNFKGVDHKVRNYKSIVDWAKYIEVNALWILAGQTTGWDQAVTPETPWGARSTEKNMHLMSKDAKKRNVAVGAYLMSFYTPANGKKKAGYAPSLGYDSTSGKLQDSLHISLKDEKRINDLASLMKEFQKNPNVDFIGFDFIRTGRADGYELGPQVVEDMNIRTPRNYEELSTIEKIKWFASKVENLRNRTIVRKWRWWRAHRVATVVNTVIRRAEITKPVWVFTLGWQHGQQHGQDPYMFFDAGVFADAVMLYEANRIQFKNMMIQWPKYMRDDLNNMVIGNAVDVRFLDNKINSHAAEYIYRTKKAYRGIYRKSKAKGIFVHDLSRALWSSKRGYDVSEWAVLHGHATSAFRQEKGLIPYKASIKFNPDLTSGKIVVENNSKVDLDDLIIKYSPTPAWRKISDNVPDKFSLPANSKKEFKFEAVKRPGHSSNDPILGFYMDHPSYPKYFFLTFAHKENQEKLLEYVN